MVRVLVQKYEELEPGVDKVSFRTEGACAENVTGIFVGVAPSGAYLLVDIGHERPVMALPGDVLLEERKPRRG